jgi:hypothetical protein
MFKKVCEVAVSTPNALNTSHFIKDTHPSVPLCHLGSLTGTWSRPSSKRDANQKRKTVYKIIQEINYQRPATWLIPWIKGNMYRVVKYSGRGVRLTTHLHPVPMLRMSGAILLFAHTPSRLAQGQLQIYHTHVQGITWVPIYCRLIPYREPGNDLFYSAFVFRCPEHRSCHRISRRMLAFYAI